MISEELQAIKETRELGISFLRAANYLKWVLVSNEKTRKLREKHNEELRKQAREQKLRQIEELRKELGL